MVKAQLTSSDKVTCKDGEQFIMAPGQEDPGIRRSRNYT